MRRESPSTSTPRPDCASPASYSLLPERIYAVTCRMVRSVAVRHGVPLQDVEDLQHEAFYRIMVRLKGFDASSGEAAMSTWMYRHATGTVLDHLRRKRRRIPSFQSREEEDSGPEVADGGESPEEAACRREVERAREECIDALPEPLRTRFRVRVPKVGPARGREEAARMLEISVDTLRSSTRVAAGMILRCMRRKGIEVFELPRGAGDGGNDS